MSGYKVERTVYNLTFTDPKHVGLTVKVRAMSMKHRLRVYLELERLSDDTAEVVTAKAQELYEKFAAHLVEWNLTEEDDTPIPATLDGFLSLEPDFIGTLLGVWKYGRQVVDAPLDEGSPHGEPLSPEVESTLMAIPSENLAS